MTNLTLDQTRRLLREVGFDSQEEDDSILVVLDPDEKFDLETPVWFFPSEGLLQVRASIDDFASELSETDRLEFCNAWNRENLWSKSYFEDGDLCVETYLYLFEDLSEDFVKSVFLTGSVESCRNFFRKLKKRLDRE